MNPSYIQISQEAFCPGYSSHLKHVSKKDQHVIMRAPEISTLAQYKFFSLKILAQYVTQKVFLSVD